MADPVIVTVAGICVRCVGVIDKEHCTACGGTGETIYRAKVVGRDALVMAFGAACFAVEAEHRHKHRTIERLKMVSDRSNAARTALFTFDAALPATEAGT